MQLPRNISETTNSKNQITGYVVRKQINKIKYQRYFKGIDLDLCLREAQEYLESIIKDNEGNTFKLIGEPLKPTVRPCTSNGTKEPACNDVGGSIYLITNKINNMKYIGQTEHWRKNRTIYTPNAVALRFKRHITSSLNGTSCCTKLANAIREHGAENFTVETLEETSLQELDNAEIKYIKMYNTMIDGYNIMPGGKSVMTPEIRSKISATVIDNWKSEEYRERMSSIGRRAQHSKAIPMKIEGVPDILPMYIHLSQKDGNPIGYYVKFVISNKKHSRSYTSSELTMLQKYNLAIEWLNNNDPRKNL